jgi:hypothetical protein
MSKYSILLIPLMAINLFCVSACTNLLTGGANTQSDAALLYQAKILIDNSDFSGAISAIQSMTTAGQAESGAKAILGSAYGGRCGLDLINLANSLTNMGASTLFEVLLQAYKGSTAAQIADCQSAEAALLGIGLRTSDENILLAFVELSKIGAILAAKGDSNSDGSPGPAFDPCSNASLTDSLTAHIGTGLTIAAASLSGTTVGGAAITPITALCTTLQAMPGMSSFCSQTSTADFDASELLLVRSLVNSNEIGLKVCNNTIGNCLCP